MSAEIILYCAIGGFIGGALAHLLFRALHWLDDAARKPAPARDVDGRFVPTPTLKAKREQLHEALRREIGGRASQ